MQLARVVELSRPIGGGSVNEDPKDEGARPVNTAMTARTRKQDGLAFDTEQTSPGDEAELVARACAGQHDAFKVLLDRHLSAVVANARRLLNDASEAEDVAQETFVRLWQRAEELDVGEAGVRPWLRMVSRNLAIDRLRSAKRLDVVDEIPEHSEAATQHVHVEEHERAQQVAQALAALPDRQRVALTLFHFEDLSQVEVADALSCSVEAVESLLSRARRRLKADLKETWRMILDETDTAS